MTNEIPADILKQIEEAAEEYRESTGWDMSEGNDIRRAFTEDAKRFYLAGLNENQRKIEMVAEEAAREKYFEEFAKDNRAMKRKQRCMSG
jgi:hypothetical protein